MKITDDLNSSNEYTIKDSYTRNHSDRVSEYSVLIGKELGLSQDDLQMLRIGGLLHDIGKTEIPDSILFKNSRLTEDEYSQMKGHTVMGADILQNNAKFKDILPTVKYHHEKYDGTGYPSNLKGEEIPLFARITAIADTFDAMTSNRPYRNALSINEAKTEIKEHSGTQFDPKITQTFLKILDNNYNEIEQIQKKYVE